MTEQEWLNGWHYRLMYDVIRHRATTRQIRLYMAACCHLKEDEFFDARISLAVETAEWCADHADAEAVVNAVWMELDTSPHPHPLLAGTDQRLASSIVGVRQVLDEYWTGVAYTSVQHAIAHAAYLALRHHPGQIFTGGAGNAAEYCAHAIHCTELLANGVKPEVYEDATLETDKQFAVSIASILRDIFGNPLRPAAINPAWLAWKDGTVVKLAQNIYDDRAFDGLPILADALEEAGCHDEEILNHCRQPGEHVRGCWVVDFLLGKA